MRTQNKLTYSKRYRLNVVADSIITEGSWVVHRVSGCTKVIIANIECFWWRNGDYYSVTEMTTGAYAGKGFTVEEALVEAEMNFTSGQWDAALIKAKKILQDNGIAYPVNETKTHPIIFN